MSQDDAITALEAAGFAVANGIEPEHSTNVAKNSVTRTEPAAGVVESASTEITIYVSDGMVDLADLSGLTQDEATTKLGELGLVTVINTQQSDATAGTVVEQQPAPGSVTQGSSVSLQIAIEIVVEQIQVPNSLVGNTADGAREALSQRGLVSEVVTVYDNTRNDGQKAADGTVVRTDPSAGSSVEVGSTVILYVYEKQNNSNQNPTDDPSDDDEDNNALSLLDLLPNGR